jgi:hypothetical protein
LIEREELMFAMKELERKRKKRARLAGNSRQRREGWIEAKIDILGSNIIKDEAQALNDAQVFTKGNNHIQFNN